ncbi:matrix metalloproteinase-2-like [Hydractinia symbiolongicarpus]|uniref:matrix metalloproteinase-2-like n=1 Tax=Hydractinia symbiolongicarpus TaxID=13093 RepID=UPI002551A2F5|nr:matrix metalloproteinase-2-like [Hydractinia symbiolongicarpus]
MTTIATSNIKVTSSLVWAMNYLARNGYYQVPDGSIGALDSAKILQNSIISLQDFAGIPVTGKFDEETKKLVQTPRCGLPDISKTLKTKRKRRFTLQGSRWSKNVSILYVIKLTWTLSNDNNDRLTRTQVEATLHKAFGKWQAITNMEFTMLHHQSTEIPDIEVKFVTGSHNDSYPFDGRGGTLAHAFYPHNNKDLSGDVHFDDDEQFTLGKNGRNLLWVAVHEIGHSIGLEHSSVKSAVMYPWYKDFDGDDFDLDHDDIAGAQHLYGKAKNILLTFTSHSLIMTPTEPTVTTKEIQNGGCPGVFKAVFLDKKSGKTYIVNNDKVFILNKSLKLEKGPVHLNTLFPGLDRIDAVYRLNEKLIFFKDSKYYIYENVSNTRRIESGSIYDKFSGLPKTVKRIDAAFIWSGNGRTYFFSGKDYYRFNEKTGRTDLNYPKAITGSWKDVPSHVDSVFEWSNGVTYFFKGKLFTYCIFRNIVRSLALLNAFYLLMNLSNFL